MMIKDDQNHVLGLQNQLRMKTEIQYGQRIDVEWKEELLTTSSLYPNSSQGSVGPDGSDIGESREVLTLVSSLCNTKIVSGLESVLGLSVTLSLASSDLETSISFWALAF